MLLLFNGEEWLDILENSGIDIVGFVYASGEIFGVGKQPHCVANLAFVHEVFNNLEFYL